MRTERVIAFKRGALVAVLFLSAAGAAWTGVSSVEPPESCEFCGMDRGMFAYSRMVVEYAGGGSVGVCCINCAAMDNLKRGAKEIRALQVADRPSERLIDAKAATWVMGGKLSGVMTDKPKWAFDTKEAAQGFIKENGGKIARFDEAWKQAMKEAKRAME